MAEEKYQQLLNDYNRLHDIYTELYNTSTIAEVERENQILRSVGDVAIVGFLKNRFCKRIYIRDGKISKTPTSQWIYVLPGVKIDEIPPVPDIWAWADEIMLEELTKF